MSNKREYRTTQVKIHSKIEWDDDLGRDVFVGYQFPDPVPPLGEGWELLCMCYLNLGHGVFLSWSWQREA